jgi:hypothetical protein
VIVDPNRAPWHKSSYSGGGNTQCVEVAPLWRKSSYSGGSNTQCVEVAPLNQTIGVRDTKNRENGHLTVPRTAWTAFVRSVAR